jgi:hypothetical protein
MTLIDIRKWYKDKGSGEIKPGNKGYPYPSYLNIFSGISLTEEQWQALKDNMGTIDEALSKF